MIVLYIPFKTINLQMSKGTHLLSSGITNCYLLGSKGDWDLQEDLIFHDTGAVLRTLSCKGVVYIFSTLSLAD